MIVRQKIFKSLVILLVSALSIPVFAGAPSPTPTPEGTPPPCPTGRWQRALEIVNSAYTPEPIDQASAQALPVDDPWAAPGSCTTGPDGACTVTAFYYQAQWVDLSVSRDGYHPWLARFPVLPQEDSIRVEMIPTEIPAESPTPSPTPTRTQPPVATGTWEREVTVFDASTPGYNWVSGANVHMDINGWVGASGDCMTGSDGLCRLYIIYYSLNDVDITVTKEGYEPQHVWQSSSPSFDSIEIRLHRIATPTPCCDTTGVRLIAPQNPILSSDAFYLDLEITNARPDVLENHRIFVILDVGGMLFFAPSWTPGPSGIDSYSMSIPRGVYTRRIIEPVPWPDLGGGGEAWFLAAITDPGITRVVGEISVRDVVW